MSVRAKFKVTELINRVSNYGTGKQDSATVKLMPVMGDENRTWSKWTPGGSIEMTITNPDAFKQFDVGQTYFVDFTPAPATEAEEKKTG